MCSRSSLGCCIHDVSTSTSFHRQGSFSLPPLSVLTSHQFTAKPAFTSHPFHYFCPELHIMFLHLNIATQHSLTSSVSPHHFEYSHFSPRQKVPLPLALPVVLWCEQHTGRLRNTALPRAQCRWPCWRSHGTQNGVSLSLSPPCHPPHCLAL